MPTMTVAKERAQNIDLFYQDIGEGDPVVLIHGWPLSSSMWERQIRPLVEANRRVIAYDRRGFGRSSQPAGGYDYDTLAADLHSLMTQLELHDATLVGFSMGGGEVARYIANYGTARLSKACLMGSVTPMLVQTSDYPKGVPREVLLGMVDAMSLDRITFLDAFVKQFYNYGKVKHNGLTDDHLLHDKMIAWMASPIATVECAKSFGTTDFRTDLTKFDVPTMIMHGDADQTVPAEGTASIAAELIPNAQLEIIKGAPHGMTLTHADAVNELLVKFVGS